MSKQSYEVQAMYCREMEERKAVAMPRPNTRKLSLRPDPDDDPARAAYLAMTPAERAADRASRAALRASDESLARRYGSRMTERMTAALLDAADAAYSLTAGKEWASFEHAGFSCWCATAARDGHSQPRLRVYAGTVEVASRAYDTYSKTRRQYKAKIRRIALESQPGALRVKSVSSQGQGDFAEAA